MPSEALLTTSEEHSSNCRHDAVSVPLDTVASAGAYVCDWSGYLLRVPERSFLPGGLLALNLIGQEPLTVTKISADPDIPLAQARGEAGRYGLRTVF